MIASLLAVLAAATHPIDLPRTFADTLPAVQARTSQPVLLPQTMPVAGDVYPTGEGHRSGWSLSLAAAPHCGGATACLIATFQATTTRRPHGSRRVTLARGRRGYFRPLACGASCAPPAIEWRERGATYAIQANVGSQRSERRILVAMANSAIRHRAR